jgi:hypothetical protein
MHAVENKMRIEGKRKGLRRKQVIGRSTGNGNRDRNGSHKMVTKAVDAIEVYKKDIRDEKEKRECLRNKGERMMEIVWHMQHSSRTFPAYALPLVPLKKPFGPPIDASQSVQTANGHDTHDRTVRYRVIIKY